MIDFLIRLLQKLKGKNVDPGQAVSPPSTPWIFFILMIIYIVLIIGGLYMNIANMSDGWIDSSDLMMIVVVFGLRIISLIALFRQRDRFLKGEEKSIDIYSVFVPMLITSMIFLTSYMRDGFQSYVSDTITYMNRRDFDIFTITGMLIGGYGNIRTKILSFGIVIFPVIAVLQTFSLRLRGAARINRIRGWFGIYNLGYFFLLSIMVSLVVFTKTRLWTEVMNEGMVGFLYALIFLFVVTYPIMAFKEYYRTVGSDFRIFIKGTLIALVAYCLFGFGAKGMESLAENQIMKSQYIMDEGGDNYETYKKAHTAFLESAYLSRFNTTKSTSDKYFNRLFDAIPETYYGSRLKGISKTARNSAGTNASRVGENADVVLKLAEIENTIITSGQDMDMMKTVYKFHMTNKTTTNQEVIMRFQTPSQYSVVSDLKLGLNGELQGIVASRGAAAKVYQDSLRINRDPALIEKIGLNTYSLRIFPVPSKTDDKTQGKQLVQLTILTPLEKGQRIIYSPQLAMINLQINKDTSLISKIYKDSKLMNEDRISTEDIGKYLKEDHVLPEDMTNQISDKKLSAYCIPEDMITSPDSVQSEQQGPIVDKDMIVLVGADNNTDAYNGDTPVTTYLPLLCIQKSSELAIQPTRISTDAYHGRAGGSIALTKNHQGLEITSRSMADKLCETDIGSGWRFAEFHDGGGWHRYAYGDLTKSSGRFWVGLNNQGSNPRGAWQDDVANNPRNRDTSRGMTRSVLNVLNTKTDTAKTYTTPQSIGYLTRDEIMPLFTGGKKIQDKISIFFDNSSSVKRDKIDSQYASIYESIRKYNNTIHDTDLYAFNFAVEKLSSPKDIKFRGYSDIDGLLDYIEKNKITGQHMILVTDSDTYNYQSTENKDRDYSDILTNSIDVLVIGDGIKTYKSDFNTMIAASRGNIYTIAKGADLSPILRNILEVKTADMLSLCEAGKDPTSNDDIRKILAGEISNMLMGVVKNKSDRTRVANTQNLIASKYQIVNQFNSMIALETAKQKADLQYYESQNARFDVGGEGLQTKNLTNNTLGVPIVTTMLGDISSEAGVASAVASQPYRGYYYGGPINASIFTILMIALIYLTQIFQIYQLLAMIYLSTRKPTDTGDNPAKSELTKPNVS